MAKDTYEALLAEQKANAEKLAPFQRARHAELREHRDTIEAKLQPLYDELAGDITKSREAELREQIKAAREPMFAIDTELSDLTRALADDKTGIAKTAA